MRKISYLEYKCLSSDAKEKIGQKNNRKLTEPYGIVITFTMFQFGPNLNIVNIIEWILQRKWF